MLAPITSVKHYVHRSTTQVGGTSIVNFEALEGVSQNAVTNAQDVVAGSVVKAIYIEMWLNGEDATNQAQFVLTIEKLPANATVMSISDSSNLTAYTNKKNVLYTTQGILGLAGLQSVPVHRGFVKIPKGKQRMGLGDKIMVNVAAVNVNIQMCGIAIFKEYT